MPVLPDFHFSLLGWAAILGGAFCIGLNKGGLPGLGVFFVLLFALVFPPRVSTGFVLPLLVIGDLCAIRTYFKVVNWKVFWTLLPPAAAGVVIGFLLMGRIPEAFFGPLIGWIILALIAVQFTRAWLGEKIDHIFQSRSFGLVMGILLGVTTMLANAAGPVAVLYLLSVGLPKWALIGTSAFTFFVINLFKVPFSAYLGLITPGSLLMAVLLAPVIVLGFLFGKYIAGAMPQKLFENFLLACTAIGALRLIW